ncbi:MAG: hypothetical protein JWL99_208 [Streptomyces oryziradicis]|jgi:hypothetical protein|nr:hypothetical protein [Actinacidiphila oryziradicis]
MPCDARVRVGVVTRVIAPLPTYGEDRFIDYGKRLLMGEHVHVRLSQGMGVSEEGQLVEQSRCKCGATWTKTYPVEDGEAE